MYSVHVLVVETWVQYKFSDHVCFLVSKSRADEKNDVGVCIKECEILKAEKARFIKSPGVNCALTFLWSSLWWCNGSET